MAHARKSGIGHAHAGGDILVIKGEREYLVPMVEGFINSIDVERGMIEVNTEGFSE